jgi:hypothetical protein
MASARAESFMAGDPPGELAMNISLFYHLTRSGD